MNWRLALAMLSSAAVWGPCCANPLGSPSTVDTPAESAAQAPSAARPGKALFEQRCAACHAGGVGKAPDPYILEIMGPTAIVEALTVGVMKQQGAGLNETQRRQIAEYLTKVDLASFKPPRPPKLCDASHRSFDLQKPPVGAGWGYDSRRFVPAAVAGLQQRDVSRLRLKWAFAFPEATRARSQPTVAMGAAVADGHVIINSGYDFAFKMPGNALLVYTIDGR